MSQADADELMLPPTISGALSFIEARLGDALPDELSGADQLRNEARAVLRVAAGISDADIFGAPEKMIAPERLKRLQSVLQRRCNAEPLAYIEGMRGFHAIELRVDQNVLIPRPETELLVDALLEYAPPTRFSVIDCGTGSGAIALAVAQALNQAQREAHIVATDISSAALEVARENGRRLGLAVEWRESDWFSAVNDECFDFICCNPPYVRSADPHLPRLRHEPRLALDGGRDGLAAIRAVVAGSVAHLNHGGRLMLEHGFDQAPDVSKIAVAAGLRPLQVLRDAAGHDRVSVFGLAD